MKELSLKQLRESLGLTQQQIADRMKVSQSDISRIENRVDLKVSTIKKFIRACGGEVEVNAITDKGKIRIDG